MQFIGLISVVTAVFSAVAAQSNNQSICDKYTTALLMENNATNQATVLTLVVNTALIGNYSNATGPAKNAVTGILKEGQYNGTTVNLAKYFDGSLKSTNRNNQAVSLNFLDGGGAAPLMMNKPAFDNATSSNQYTLVTHLYQIFGSLLGCSQQGPNSAFMSYQGNPSMSAVHRYMNLDPTEMGYFIQEVGRAATSFGVSAADAMAVGQSLNNAFNYRCLPPTSLGPGLANASQSTCLATECPVAPNGNCTNSGESFGNGTSGDAPQQASSSGSGSGSGGSGSGSGSGSGGSDSSSQLLVNGVGFLALAAAGVLAVSL